ncbi:hypothetical protein [Butyrivibrio sp. JL13D10]|uniref:hypothetical protein n=1 Tax=Butyrivibrio sp. JL13D10 TaxID=3236815 RepID=UPI0038B645F6
MKNEGYAYREFFDNYDYYWLKYTLERGKKEQASSLLVGHSLPRFAINDRDIDGLINLAFLSQDYYYSGKIIERSLVDIPSLKTVVLGTSYISSFIDLSRMKNRDELSRIVKVYDRYFHDPHNANMDVLEEIRKELLNKNAHAFDDEFEKARIFKMYDERKDNYFCNECNRQNLSDVVWINLPDEKRIEEAKIRTVFHNRLLEHMDTYHENSEILQRIAMKCHEKGIRFLMVVFPLNSYYREYLDPGYREYYQKQIDSIPEEYRPECFDFSEAPQIDSVSDFVDSDHLNDTGATKMTSIFSGCIGGKNK